MNPIKNNGNYFIKDAEIVDSQYDKFKHSDVAKNIINIIENNTSPFNIAIVGKWGLGKSSLINMVKQYLSLQKEKYIIEDVNAWKYEKEALKRVLLRRTLSNLDYTNKSAFTELFDGLTSHKGAIDEKGKTFCERLKTEWLPLLGDAILIYVIGIVLSIIAQCIISKVKISAFDLNARISFVLNNFASNFYIPLLVVLFEKYINTSKGKYNFKITPPITSVDEYELELEIRLSKEKYKYKKIIVIIDDLDRLTPNKIVEALDAIKAFVGYPNFIFIVPFDDTILKDAIKREKTNFVYNEHLTIESDLFLDKLFQYRISLPSIIQSNIPQYAIEAAQKDAEDLIELCGKEDFELICKEILIHKKVSTPRQAKKIVNTFSGNLLLGYRRECSGVAAGVFTSLSGKRFLAKISVLQSDFPSFYSNMFVDNTIMDTFLNLTDSEKIEEITNELLLPYFTKKGDRYVLNKTGESLSMFLHRTSSVTANNIARFLYLNDDRLSELFGNEFNLTIRDGLSSGAYKLVREKIEANLDKDITYLLYEILSNSDPIEFEFCCIGIINISDINIIKSEIKLLSLLNDRLSSIFISKDIIQAKNLNIVNAIDIFKLHDKFSGLDKLILNQFKNEENDLTENLSVFFEKEDSLSKTVKQYIKELISTKCSTSQSKLNFNDLFSIKLLDIDSFSEEYLSGLDMFERLFNEIISEETYDPEDVIVAAFVKLFGKHVQSSRADKALKIISSNLNNAEFAELIIKDIGKNANNFKDISIVSLACMKLIETNNDDIKDNVNYLLSKVKWTIISNKSEVVDKYLTENLGSQYIDVILLNVANNKQIDLIPETIKSIHSAIFDENVRVQTVFELQKQYDDAHSTELIEALKPAFAYSNTDGSILEFTTELLKQLAQNINNKTYITQLADYIYSQNSISPTQMAVKVQKISEFKHGITNTSVQNFISWANSNINSYPMTCVNILNVFKNEIIKTEYVTCGNSIMNNSTEDTLELSLALLRIFRTEFKKETVEITTYKDFLISHLNNNNCRKSIIKDLIDYYSSITEVNKFISEVVKYNDITEESIVAITKFKDKYSAEQTVSDVKSIIETAHVNHIENVDSIFSGWLGENYASAILHLLEDVDSSISVIYGMNLIKLAIRRSDVSNVLKIKLISIMLEICDDTILPEILSESEQIGKLTKHLEKRQLGLSLYNAFRNTSSDDFKIQVFSLVKLTGTRSAFETDEKKNRREFSDQDISLIKHRK